MNQQEHDKEFDKRYDRCLVFELSIYEYRQSEEFVLASASPARSLKELRQQRRVDERLDDLIESAGRVWKELADWDDKHRPRQPQQKSIKKWGQIWK